MEKCSFPATSLAQTVRRPETTIVAKGEGKGLPKGLANRGIFWGHFRNKMSLIVKTCIVSIVLLHLTFYL